jgi:hypothetical protein
VLDREIACRRALAVDHRDAADAEDRAAERLENIRAVLNDQLPDWSTLLEEQK